MNILLWVLQILLALAFLAHGLMLLFPPANLIEAMNATMSTAFRNFLGVAEVLAAVGLTVPGVTRLLPWWLVPAAAAGIMIVMISATIFHIQRGEVSSAITTAILLLMATFVAYMRWRVRPIALRRVA